MRRHHYVCESCGLSFDAWPDVCPSCGHDTADIYDGSVADAQIRALDNYTASGGLDRDTQEARDLLYPNPTEGYEEWVSAHEDRR